MSDVDTDMFVSDDAFTMPVSLCFTKPKTITIIIIIIINYYYYYYYHYLLLLLLFKKKDYLK